MRRSIQYSQNFLRMSPAIENLVAQSSLGPEDTVLDIGAGKGSLTALMARKSKQVIAIETDPRLVKALRTQFAHRPNVAIHEGDFLRFPLPTLPYKVFANIPFNKTSEIVHKLLDGPEPPTDCYLILQREAAEKFASSPGRQSLFSTLHAPWFALHILHEFRSTDFTPAPAVTVVLLRCEFRSEPIIPLPQRQMYYDLVSYIFNHANPNILPSLQKLFVNRTLDEILASLGAYATAKPSQLPYAAWYSLFDVFARTARLPQHRLIQGAAAKLSHEASTIEKHHRTRLAPNWRDTAE